ncbi:hypothetical protein J2S55_009768 [Streptosporangium brasiliense]|uniref:Uncharacterized protein n=1 Tax=Streptosporangium brasiliense TaxID=47480 RepID=A0ABT9RPZ0_9ACTN|nr:hypothetical protein [Streptosporangium brasiliense]
MSDFLIGMAMILTYFTLTQAISAWRERGKK